MLPSCSQTLLVSSRDAATNHLVITTSTLNGNMVEVLYPMYWRRSEKKFVLHTVLSKLSYKNTYFDFCSHETKQNSRIQLQSRLKRFASSRNCFSRSHRTFICNVRFSRTMVERRARPTMTFGREERKERNNQLDHSASEAGVSSSSSL